MLRRYIGFIVSLTATLIPQDISLPWTPPSTPNVDLDITYCVGVVNSTFLLLIHSQCGIAAIVQG